MSDNVNNESTANAEWVVEFWKGGPGSGENPGHPFRGNRYTGGVQSAKHHETREGTERYTTGDHLSAAKSNIAAGQAALGARNFGLARRHFNEAAYYAAKASSLIQHGDAVVGGGGTREMGQHAELLYHAAHHAGDAAERASYLSRKLASVRTSGMVRVNPSQLFGSSAGAGSLFVPNTDAETGRTLVPENTRGLLVSSTELRRVTDAVVEAANQQGALAEMGVAALNTATNSAGARSRATEALRASGQ